MLEELVKALGFKIEEVQKEGFDVLAAVAEFEKNKETVFLNRSDLIDPIKEKAKTEAEIVAIKRFKKDIVSVSGISVENLEEAKVKDLLDLAKTKLIEGSTTEVRALQQQLIEQSNNFAKEKEVLEAETNKKIEALTNAEKKAKIALLIEKELAGEYITPIEDAIDTFNLRASKANVIFDLDEKGGLVLKSETGGLALTDDNKTVATVSYLKDKFLNGFIKKSNGSGDPDPEGKIAKKEDLPENLPIGMKENLERLNKAFA